MQVRVLPGAPIGDKMAETKFKAVITCLGGIEYEVFIEELYVNKVPGPIEFRLEWESPIKLWSSPNWPEEKDWVCDNQQCEPCINRKESNPHGWV